MVNSVMSSLTTFFLCSIKVPISILNQIDKYRRHCLWRGRDINARKPPMAAWKMVTMPKLKGGLGVLNLRRQNEALLTKYLHKFYNKEDLPWVQLIWFNYYNNRKLPGSVKRGSFWWRSIIKLVDQYKGIAQTEAGNGSTILFWTHMWNGRVP
jgi:hypothetical protein